MARLWSSGGELNTLTQGVEVTSIANTPVMEATIIRSGTYSFEASGEGIDSIVYQPVSGDTDTTKFYMRVYMRIAALPDATVAILRVLDAGANLSGDIRLTTGGALQLFQRGNTQVGSDSAALSEDVWYRIEMVIEPTAAGTGELRGRIDGVEFAGSASASTDSMHTVRWGKASTATAELYFDDIAINDDTGSFQNSWPGEGEIIHLRPNDDGDNNGWNNGLNPKDYTQTDEVTPDDATSYISEISDGVTSSFNIDATPAALEETDTINCVQVGVVYASVVGGGSSPTFVVQIKSDTGATIEQGTEITPTLTNYRTNATASPRNYSLTLYDLPGASTTAWTKATLDTAQIGVDTTAAGAKEARVSTLWLLVDHKPTEAVASTSSTNFMTTNTKFW